MKYWYYKLDIYSLEHNNINFKTRTKFKGKIGDRIVFITGHSGEFSFKNYGIINLIEFEKLDDKLYNTEISLTIYEIAKQANFLKNYNYSIKRITNFESPAVNFKAQLGSLHKAEYEGIINGEYFYARTAFGKYVNALPQEHQLAFIKYFMEIAPEIYFNTTKNFDRALEVLENYIENRITIPAIFMNESFKILTDYVLETELNEIGLSKEGETIDYLKPQIDIIESYLKEVRNKEEKVEINQDFRNSEIQFLYKKHFAKSDWPINLDYETGFIK